MKFLNKNPASLSQEGPLLSAEPTRLRGHAHPPEQAPIDEQRQVGEATPGTAPFGV